MTKIRTLTVDLTDARNISSLPLNDLRGKDIEYRDSQGVKFLYPAAELIAAGYDCVPEYLTVDVVYILQPKKSSAT